MFSAAAPSWAVGTGGTRFGRFPGGGEPRDTVREDRRRRRAQRPHRRQPHGQPARAVGRPRPGRGRRRAAPPRGRPGRRVRRHELQHVPGQPLDHPRRRRVLQVRQPGQHRRGGAAGGHRPQPLRHRPRPGARVAGADRVAGRRHEPPGPGQLPRPVRAGAGRAGRDLRPPARRLGDVHRAQALRAGLLLVGEQRLGHLAAAGPGHRRPGQVPGRPRPPPAQHQHRAGGVAPGHGGPAGRLPLQRLEVRRRRPHRRAPSRRSSCS